LDPIHQERAIAAAAEKAKQTNRQTEVFMPAGVYFIEGPIVVPDGVVLQGESSSLTAIYSAYDNASTAPLALFSPTGPGANWEMRNLTVYVLSLYHSVFWVPGRNATSQCAGPVESHTLGNNCNGRFRLSGVVSRLQV
jgi:hypothetical protein